MEPGQRPGGPGGPGSQSHDHGFPVPVQYRPGGGLKVPDSQVQDREVLHVVPKGCHIVHVAQGGFPDGADAEAPQGLLEEVEEGLQLDDVQDHGQGVPLPDAEEDLQVPGEVVEHEGGEGPFVEGLDPPAESLPEAHGLEDSVHPYKADPVVGVEEVETHQESRLLAPLQELHRGEDGGCPVEDGAPFHGT